MASPPSYEALQDTRNYEAFKKEPFVQVNPAQTWETVEFLKNESPGPDHKSGFLTSLLPKRLRHEADARRFPHKEPNALPGWKPVTLRAPILASFIAVSIAMIVALEVLSYISSGNGNRNGGGIAFAIDTDHLSWGPIFGFLYLPTIIAVVYSMVWSWVDLDVKRLEPWFQLSRENGATADDSLLLQYPFDFLPLVPFGAIRRKHWGVLYTGTVMLLVFWVITPLQSAIFNIGIARRSIQTKMGSYGNLMPLQAQATKLNANFLNTAYGISWLGEDPPEYTSRNYAVLPFRPVNDIKTYSSETWSTDAKAFSTSLTCAEAEVSRDRASIYTFSNGRGCSVELTPAPLSSAFGQGIMLNYIGYFNDPHVDWFLQNPNCTVEHSNNFLALWGSKSNGSAFPGMYDDLQASFCQTSYSVSDMTITVNASNHRIVEGHPKSGGQNDTATRIEDVFNVTSFEYLVATAVNPTLARANLQDTVTMEQFPRIQDKNVTWPVSLMVGFALALGPPSASDFSSPTVIHDAFQKAHRVLFSSAFSTLTEVASADEVDPKLLTSGMIHDSPGAILLVRPIAITVEAIFGLITLLCIALWWYSSHRPSNLKADPASIADLMALLKNHEEAPLNGFSGNRTLTEDGLKSSLSNTRFQLLKDGSQIIQMDSHTTHSWKPNRTDTSGGESKHLQEDFVAKRPLELRTATGMCLIATIFAFFSLLVFLFFWSKKLNGLSLPSTNPVVLSILENYLPTAVATFLEPIWVILNRLLCLLKPFDHLRQGNAKPSASIGSKYNSLPPQLVIWRAIRSGHYLLAMVCVVAVSTNLLAVTLTTLLSESSITTEVGIPASQNILPLINGTFQRKFRVPASYYDHFYVKLANLSQNTSLPAWVDDNHFYLPFTLEPPSSSPNAKLTSRVHGFKGLTAGFGAKVTCNVLSAPIGQNNGVSFLRSPDGSSTNFSTSHILPNGKNITCFPGDPKMSSPGINDAKTLSQAVNGNFPAGKLNLAASMPMFPDLGIDDDGFCRSLLIAGYVRGTSTQPINSTTGSPIPEFRQMNNMTSIFLACTPTLVQAQFDISVDPSGRIINSTQTSAYLPDTSHLFLTNFSSSLLFTESSDLIAPRMPRSSTWNNDSFTVDWMNSLLGIQLNSSQLMDPSLPIPPAETIVPLTANMYQQLFAILLGLNYEHVFASAAAPVPVTVTALVVEQRLFVSTPMFAVSAAILFLHFVVAVGYYVWRPKNFLPRMPTSVASVIAYVAASRDLGAGHSSGGSQNSDGSSSSDGGLSSGRNRVLGAGKWYAGSEDGETRYGYGRFVGTDGKTHVGIERQRYIVPLESRNPSAQRRKWGTFNSKVSNDSVVKSWI